MKTLAFGSLVELVTDWSWCWPGWNRPLDPDLEPTPVSQPCRPGAGCCRCGQSRAPPTKHPDTKSTELWGINFNLPGQVARSPTTSGATAAASRTRFLTASSLPDYVAIHATLQCRPLPFWTALSILELSHWSCLPGDFCFGDAEDSPHALWTLMSGLVPGHGHNRHTLSSDLQGLRRVDGLSCRCLLLGCISTIVNPPSPSLLFPLSSSSLCSEALFRSILSLTHRGKVIRFFSSPFRS
ncbi:hypothetical protein N657DRAFT_337138 [Parathielavia appendiculata]|uniref:Uncharacterized protein n=1 Tax=Parathielavia appendiculata TaxID=2587402 RepID=A0AAN6U2Q7_9PEZI|nr:hypothetical protein N657DRAFT_337138 [Parathielavia appendiculata]